MRFVTDVSFRWACKVFGGGAGMAGMAGNQGAGTAAARARVCR